MGFYYANYGVFNKTVGLLLKNRGKEPRLVSYYCPIFGFYQSFSLGVFQFLENAKPVVLGLSEFRILIIPLSWGFPTFGRRQSCWFGKKNYRTTVKSIG